MLAMLIGFAGVGSLRFAPWLLLLVPFVFVRVSFQKSAGAQTIFAGTLLPVANVVVEAAMIAMFFYLYNMSVLTLLPASRLTATSDNQPAKSITAMKH